MGKTKNIQPPSSRSRRKNQRIVPGAPIGYYEISSRGDRLISVDDDLCEFIGYSREELLSMDPLSLLDDRSISAFFKIVMKKELENKISEQAVFRVKTKGGRFRTFLAELVEFRHLDGSQESAKVLARNVARVVA